MSLLIFWLGLSVILLSYMTVWYGIALYTHRLDVVDSAWGIGFILTAWVSLALKGRFGNLQVISALLVSIWGLRLFIHIAKRNWRKHEDDHRYQLLRNNWGSAAKRKAYTNVFLLQALLVMVVSLPMIGIAFAGPRTPNIGTYLGWFIWSVGIVVETLADYQLSSFLKSRAPGSHAIMDQGLWHYSRHPNYFGELTSWWGAAVVAFSIGSWWGAIGAVAITLLITKISGIPPLERHYDGNRAYDAYRTRTSVLIPLPPKGTA